MEKAVKTERMCVSCRRKSTKETFIRVVKTKEGEIAVCPESKINGRSVYICNNRDCVGKAIKTKAINRAFKSETPQVVYEQLGKIYEKLK